MLGGRTEIDRDNNATGKGALNKQYLEDNDDEIHYIKIPVTDNS